MDESLTILVDETQTNNDDDNYLFNLNLNEDMRNKYSVLGLILGIIINISIVNFI